MSGLKDLGGKTAVVTGGASGIGRGIAERLVGQQMNVVITDIDADGVARTAEELGCTGLVADVTRPEDLESAAEHTVEQFGAVHVIINNAGVGSMGRISDLTLADWRWMIDVNLFGVIHGINAFLPLLKANPEGGHVVNTSSMAGLTANANMGAYTAGKFGVVGLTEVLALELAEEGSAVGATVLCPGPVRSNIKASLRTRPAGQTGGLFDVDASAEGPLATMRWMDPLECGDLVVNAIRNGDPYIITHPELWQQISERFDRIGHAFGASDAI